MLHMSICCKVLYFTCFGFSGTNDQNSPSAGAQTSDGAAGTAQPASAASVQGAISVRIFEYYNQTSLTFYNLSVIYCFKG